jgi:hypothetical protein
MRTTLPSGMIVITASLNPACIRFSMASLRTTKGMDPPFSLQKAYTLDDASSTKDAKLSDDRSIVRGRIDIES